MLSRDFKEFIELLNRNEVRYLVVGGYAVAVHGYPRYTKDLDVWIQLSQENAEKIVKALVAFGFGSLGLQAEDFMDEGMVIQLGYPPNRIDLLTSLKGLNFEDCYQSSVKVRIEDLNVSFIDLPHLIENKQATGRLQDLADIENLQQ
ncbi:MAG: hypothetical protein KGY42_07415 [Desulfobacterales bacterium]|nr:hypothetical protein [Desulfobacterales bacterium]MBS3756444.1 hypothetical protein [Desulfobacterales bacterium]